MTDLEEAILQFVARPSYQPVKARVIAQRLKLPKDRLAEVKMAVKRLVRRGQLAYGANHLLRPAGSEAPRGSRVMGAFTRTAKGFGFVRPSQPIPEPGAARPEDIYIPAKWTADAATGDTVLVQLHKRDPGPRGQRGEIVEVVQRETHRFVGTYFEDRGVGYVQIDGKLFAEPISVGDPGAKNVQPDDKVVIEMVRFPTPLREGEGVIEEVLGPAGRPGVDTLSIIRQFGLPDAFAADALEEARQQADALTEDLPPERLDLSGETIVTIDPIDARDFDDAISLVQQDNGHWLLGVHIADVSHFVRPRTALDREARDRGTSVYLPDRVVPMLPEIISNGLASLQPGKIRYTQTALLEFTPDGVRVDAQLHRSAIRSSRRLTYEEVDAFLADREAWQKKLGAEVHALLGRMHQLAMILRARRLKHGALELNMPEVKVQLDRTGRVSGARVMENTESHQIIEEFMLAANEAVAQTLRDKGLVFLRRVHQSPSPYKLKVLTEFVHELGLPVENLQSRFELQKLLDTVRGRPEERAVNYATLRAMQRAVYGPQEEGHFALASECYCHFTSPIRRYPDLTVHRLLTDLSTGRKPRNDFDECVVLGQHCSDREQRAEAAERELTKLKLLAYLSDHIGLEMDGVVTGVESFGLFVQGLDLPAEGLIHTDALSDDFYAFDRATHTLAGRRRGNRYRLGDPLQVVVARVDLERRELDFRLVARKERPPTPFAASPKVRRGPKRGEKPAKSTKRRGKRRG
jgi:ribonuclease R